MYLIGYDIGSSSIKTSLVHAETREVIDVVQYPEQEMEMISRQKGWAEQQPELWWRYVCLGTEKILRNTKVDPAEITSIGISYQMHGLVIVDGEQQVLRPAIIWCDSRAVSIGDRAYEAIGKTYCLEHYQNSPGNFTASKLKWVKDNEPEIYRKAHKIMLPGDFIAMKLSGEISTTVSGLSEGILWDFKAKRVATRLLEHYDLDQDLIPEIKPTFSVSGRISASAAKQTGLVEGTAVSYRAGDQPNNAMSLSVLRPGEVAATSGTSGVVYGVVDKTVVDEDSRVNAFAHVNHTSKRTRTGVLLCINGAGIQYSWLRNQVARPNRSYNDMERMLSCVPVGSEGVLIFPFGNGAERIFQNRNIESHISNIEFNRHTRAHLYRAAIEGVAFAFVHGIEILKSLGISVKRLKVGNDNMFQSEVFSTTIATLLDIEIEVYNTTGAVGAALASGYGNGQYQSIEKALAPIKPVKRYSAASNVGEYTQAYHYWKDQLDLTLKHRSMVSDYEREEILQKDKLIAKQSLILEEQRRKLEEMKTYLDYIKHEGQNKSLDQMISRLKRNDRDVEDMADHVDLLLDPYIENLRTLYPDLSYEELKMCNYLKLKFTTKEIADKLNLSYRGAETKRYRLRKKMSIRKGTSLSSFLGSIPST